ncbi:postacrosomal sheath WW domain-binding protein isoform X2 [Pezoporus occidentalis]|uniref:postacrosomal sheath WW domain-binding protein isoform X2 n=1 Tax=Pezoporus occidentalis TaxID=407982 RepID=UPI002F91302E
MALNRHHSQEGGVVIPNAESVLKHCKDVELSFSDVTGKPEAFRGTKKGMLYLTPYRMIFVSKGKDPMLSFMMPFYLVKGCSIEQPVFSANYIKGQIQAEAGASSGVPLQNPGYGYTPFPGGYAPTPPAPEGYAAPPPPNGPYPYAPPPMNAYGPAPQPMGYPYAQTPGIYPPLPNMSPMFVPPPLPPYSGPSAGPAASVGPGMPGDSRAMEATSSAYYNSANPHNVYMPVDQPPPYTPPEDKKNN